MAGARGWWPPTAAFSPSGTPSSPAPPAPWPSTNRWWGWPLPPTGRATGWWPPTAAFSPSGTPSSPAPPAPWLSTNRWWGWPLPPMEGATGWWPPKAASSPSGTPHFLEVPADKTGTCLTGGSGLQRQPVNWGCDVSGHCWSQPTGTPVGAQGSCSVPALCCCLWVLRSLMSRSFALRFEDVAARRAVLRCGHDGGGRRSGALFGARAGVVGGGRAPGCRVRFCVLCGQRRRPPWLLLLPRPAHRGQWDSVDL